MKLLLTTLLLSLALNSCGRDDSDSDGNPTQDKDQAKASSQLQQPNQDLISSLPFETNYWVIDLRNKAKIKRFDHELNYKEFTDYWESEDGKKLVTFYRKFQGREPVKCQYRVLAGFGHNTKTNRDSGQIIIKSEEGRSFDCKIPNYFDFEVTNKCQGYEQNTYRCSSSGYDLILTSTAQPEQKDKCLLLRHYWLPCR